MFKNGTKLNKLANMKIMDPHGQNFTNWKHWKYGENGQKLKVWTKLDKIGQFDFKLKIRIKSKNGQKWNFDKKLKVWTKLDKIENMEKIGQYWTKIKIEQN